MWQSEHNDMREQKKLELTRICASSRTVVSRRFTVSALPRHPLPYYVAPSRSHAVVPWRVRGTRSLLPEMSARETLS